MRKKHENIFTCSDKGKVFREKILFWKKKDLKEYSSEDIELLKRAKLNKSLIEEEVQT